MPRANIGQHCNPSVWLLFSYVRGTACGFQRWIAHSNMPRESLTSFSDEFPMHCESGFSLPDSLAAGESYEVFVTSTDVDLAAAAFPARIIASENAFHPATFTARAVTSVVAQDGLGRVVASEERLEGRVLTTAAIPA